jgi:hypothetical protein
MLRTRYIPGNAQQVATPTLPKAAIYVYEKDEKPIALIYYGKAAKPISHVQFRSHEERYNAIAEYIKKVQSQIEDINTSKKQKKEYQHNLKIGDILYSSWGYDQTNVDFYEVVRVAGKAVYIREIASSCKDDKNGFMSGKVVPIKNKYISDEMRKIPQGFKGEAYVKVGYHACALLWDGLPKNISWYA